MRMKIFSSVFAVILLSVAAVTAAPAGFPSDPSANDQPADTIIRVEDIVVTATRTYVNRNNIPLSISTVQRAEIEQSSESALLPVLSQRVPGLFVTEKGITGFGLSDGAAGAINIRGVGQGNKVLMLFDGQPQWAGVFGHHLPDVYVASDVERVEVIRGPGSLIYGSNAMGGVVNVLTRKQLEEGSSLQARLMYGSYDTRKYMLSNGSRKGRWSSFVSLNHDRTEGHRPNSDFRITNGFAKVGYDISDHFAATADISLAGYRATNPGTIYRPIYDNTIDILRGTASLALENHYAKGNGAVRLFYNFGHHEINDGHSLSEAPLDYLFHSQDHNYGILAYESFSLFRGNSFTAGVDYKNWGGTAWKAYSNRSDRLVDKSVDETAGYLILQQQVIRRVSLSAGIRLEHNSTFGQVWVPQAGLAWNPGGNTHLKASVSKGFRSPNIRELYMFIPANPDLKPENMLSYEASLGRHFLGGKLFAGLTVYYIDGKEMIQTVTVNSKPKNINTGTFKNKGIEFEADWHIAKNLSFTANYSYLDAETPLLAAPEHQAFVAVTYRPGRFSFHVNAQHIGGLYLKVPEGSSSGLLENYTLINARISYRANGPQRQGPEFFVKGENLTDRYYTINYGFPMPGIVMLGGVNLPIRY